MRWYVADKEYVKFLKSIDDKVEDINYGEDSFKPYIGIILEIGSHNYYLPISSAKPKHERMKNSKDFLKLCDKDGKLLSVLNINNMIPIPPEFIIELKYDQIEQYRTFESELAKNQYIDLLRKELEIIKSMPDRIKENATYIHGHYKLYPSDRLSLRCCNFMLLEEKSAEYKVL